MIRLVSKPLLKGRPLGDEHPVDTHPAPGHRLGMNDLSNTTHIILELVCQPEDEAEGRAQLLAQLRQTARQWERHYESISKALSL